VIATIYSNDRAGLSAAALVAGGLGAAGSRPTVVALAADSAQACGLARLSGAFDLVLPKPREAMAAISDHASRSTGDVVALLPTDLIHVNRGTEPGRIDVVASACGLTAAQALHAATAGTWHLRCDGGYGQPAWRMAPRVLPMNLPRLSPLDRIRLVSGQLDEAMRYAAVALAATFLAVSVDPTAERFESSDLAALLSEGPDGDEDLVRERLLRCAAALSELGSPAAIGPAQAATGRRPRETRPTPAPARARSARAVRLHA
jgi:hypothetical protein